MNSTIRPFFKKLTWETLLENGIERFYPTDAPIFHYTSVQAAKEILLSGQLLMSKVEKFNDPFDLNNSLLTVDTSPAEGWYMDIVDNYVNDKPELKCLSREEQTQAFRVERLSDQLTYIKSMISIGCFSRVHDNTLMWSHYASKHSGICLGFNYNKLSANKILVADVSYKDKIEPINFFKDTAMGLLHWIFTKSSVWEYEKEVRAIIAEDSPYSPFPTDSLMSIYYGVRTSEYDITIIDKILKAFNYQPEIKTSMEMNYKTFRVKEKANEP